MNPRIAATAVSLTVAMGLAACATTESLAPVPASGGAVAAEGRRLYLTCAGSCHAPEPPANYSLEAWRTIHLPDMANRAKLSAAERAALEAYVFAVCR